MSIFSRNKGIKRPLRNAGSRHPGPRERLVPRTAGKRRGPNDRAVFEVNPRRRRRRKQPKRHSWTSMFTTKRRKKRRRR